MEAKYEESKQELERLALRVSNELQPIGVPEEMNTSTFGHNIDAM